MWQRARGVGHDEQGDGDTARAGSRGGTVAKEGGGDLGKGTTTRARARRTGQARACPPYPPRPSPIAASVLMIKLSVTPTPASTPMPPPFALPMPVVSPPLLLCQGPPLLLRSTRRCRSSSPHPQPRAWAQQGGTAAAHQVWARRRSSATRKGAEGACAGSAVGTGAGAGRGARRRRTVVGGSVDGSGREEGYVLLFHYSRCILSNGLNNHHPT